MSDQLAKDLETLENLNRMANQETLPAVEDAKIGTPVEEVEKALVEYYKRELSYMTEIGQMHLESLWLEIEHRIPEMKTGELINTLQAMKQLHNDELSKSTSPIVSLLTKIQIPFSISLGPISILNGTPLISQSLNLYPGETFSLSSNSILYLFFSCSYIS